MEKHQIEELDKLKSLLNSGILTQDEFETEKAKVLNSSTTSRSAKAKEDSRQSTLSSNKSDLQKVMSDKRSLAIIFSVTFLVIFIAVVISHCNGSSNQTYYSANDSVAVDTAETTYSSEADFTNGGEDLNLDNFVQDGSEEDFEINCPWRKEYFHNDFGEDMPEHPYIVTTIGGCWNLEIAYSHEIGFRFALRDNDGEYKHIYSPISIVFRTQDGKMYEALPDNVENNCVFIQNSDDVSGIAELLETQSKFDILMSYEMYNEPHRMTWNVDYLGGTSMFNKAVERFL